MARPSSRSTRAAGGRRGAQKGVPKRGAKFGRVQAHQGCSTVGRHPQGGAGAQRRAQQGRLARQLCVCSVSVCSARNANESRVAAWQCSTHGCKRGQAFRQSTSQTAGQAAGVTLGGPSSLQRASRVLVRGQPAMKAASMQQVGQRMQGRHLLRAARAGLPLRASQCSQTRLGCASADHEKGGGRAGRQRWRAVARADRLWARRRRWVPNARCSTVPLCLEGPMPAPSASLITPAVHPTRRSSCAALRAHLLRQQSALPCRAGPQEWPSKAAHLEHEPQRLLVPALRRVEVRRCMLQRQPAAGAAAAHAAADRRVGGGRHAS